MTSSLHTKCGMHTVKDIAKSRITVNLSLESTQILHHSDICGFQRQSVQKCIEPFRYPSLVSRTKSVGLRSAVASRVIVRASVGRCQRISESEVDRVRHRDDKASVSVRCCQIISLRQIAAKEVGRSIDNALLASGPAGYQKYTSIVPAWATYQTVRLLPPGVRPYFFLS